MYFCVIIQKIEVEISKFPDDLPTELNKNLKKKKRMKKSNIQKATNDEPLISFSYQALYINP